MKQILVLIAAVTLILAVAYSLPQAQMGGHGMMGESPGYEKQAPAAKKGYGYGMMGDWDDWGDCGMRHRMMHGPGYGYGMGMMHGYGYGPGMMHGYGYGPGMMYGPGYGYGMGPGMMHGYEGDDISPGMMYGPGYGYGMGPGMMYGPGYGYGPKSQKFLDETKDLRRQLHTKMFDYMEAARDPETKREQLDKMHQEIQDLKKQIHEKYGK